MSNVTLKQAQAKRVYSALLNISKPYNKYEIFTSNHIIISGDYYWVTNSYCAARVSRFNVWPSYTDLSLWDEVNPNKFFNLYNMDDGERKDALKRMCESLDGMFYDANTCKETALCVHMQPKLMKMVDNLFDALGAYHVKIVTPYAESKMMPIWYGAEFGDGGYAEAIIMPVRPK